MKEENTKTVFFLESSMNIGGQEWQLLQQMVSLDQQGFSTRLFCKKNSRVDVAARAKGLSVINVPFCNSVHLPTIYTLIREIKKQRPIACLCHSGHDANNLGIASLFLFNRPKIIRSRTYYTSKRPNIFNQLLPLDLVMVPSQYMATKVKPYFPGRKIEVVYPGIAFDKLDSEEPLPLRDDLETWLAKSDGEIMIQIGMLRAEKGHQIIIAAMSELVKKTPNLRYVIAGGGDDAALKKQIAERQLGSNVWIGELASVASALKRADLLVMPSTKEPLGMAQIEALGLSVPVIISNEGGLPETVQNGVTGIIVAKNEPQAWVQAIEFALANKERMRSYSAAGKKEVRAKFTLAANTQALVNIITR